MKSSKSITLTILATIAGFITGCTNRDYAHCTDANHQVVADSNCDTNNGFVDSYLMYRWLYAPRSYPVGHVFQSNEYTYAPHTGFSTPRASSSGITTRGGFGGSAHFGTSGAGE